MDAHKLLVPTLVSALAAFAAPRIASAIDDAPNYNSRDTTERPAQWGFGTPEEDGRPGQYFYYRAVDAVKHKQYKFAIDMYETSASWAYTSVDWHGRVSPERTMRRPARVGPTTCSGRTPSTTSPRWRRPKSGPGRTPSATAASASKRPGRSSSMKAYPYACARWSTGNADTT